MALYNVGRCFEDLGQLEEARDAYERFLAEGGRDSDGAGDAERQLANIETRLAMEGERRQASREGSEGPSPTVESAPASGGIDDVGGWVLLAVGAGVAIAGGILLGVGLNDVAQVDSAPMGTRWSELQAAHDRSAALTGFGIAALALGGLMAAAGLTWVLVAGEPTDDRVALELQWAGDALHLRGRY